MTESNAESHRLGPPLVLRIAARNRVTRKEFQAELTLVELEVTGVILEVPQGSFQQGNAVDIHLQLLAVKPASGGEAPGKSERELRAEGKVSRQSIGGGESRTGEQDTVTISFLKYDDQAWEGLLAWWRARQAQVDRALEAMRK